MGDTSLPAWVQAIGSLSAILAAIALSAWQQREGRRLHEHALQRARHDRVGDGKWSRSIVQDPRAAKKNGQWDIILGRVDDLLKSLIVDLNWEVTQREKGEGVIFDYKSALKSPSEIQKLMVELIKSFEKEVGKGSSKSFDEP